MHWVLRAAGSPRSEERMNQWPYSCHVLQPRVYGVTTTAHTIHHKKQALWTKITFSSKWKLPGRADWFLLVEEVQKNYKKKDFFKSPKLPIAELFQLLIFLWKGKENLQEFR